MTKKQAIKLYESKFYEKLNDYEKVKFQLFEDRLCMPFKIFHLAMEKILNRQISPSEFAFKDALIKEFLGEKEKPSIKERLNLISKDKLILIQPEDEES